MIRRLLASVLHRLGLLGRARGGTLPPYRPRRGEVMVYLSPGEYRPPRRG